MNFQQKIEKALNSKGVKSPEKVFHETCFILANEFGWSYNDIIEAPIPFVLGVLSELGRFKKKENNAMKKARRN